MGFLQSVAVFCTRLAAATHLADEEPLQVAVIMEDFLKLRGNLEYQ